MLISHDKDQQ